MGTSHSTSRPSTSTSTPILLTYRPFTSTSRPSTSTSRPSTSTSTPSTSTSTPILLTYRPLTSTSRPSTSTSRPSTSTSRPSTSTSRPSTSTSTPSTSTSTPSTSTFTPSTSTFTLSTSTSRPFTSTSRPSTSISRPSTSTSRPSTSTSKLSTSISTPSTSTSKLSTSTSRPSTSTSKLSTSTSRPSTSTSTPSTSTSTPSTSTSRPSTLTSTPSTLTSTPSTQTSSTAQIPRVVFDDAYKQGTVYVLPPIQKLKVNVFQETNVKTPLDPAMPYKTKTHAMQVDEAKLTSGQDKLKGDQDEACVLKLLYEQLQKATHPGDTPVFLFCSLMLSNQEKDIVIFHRKYGVIIVEVKGVGNPRSFDRLKKAAKQLLNARDAIRTELQGLLAPDAFTLLMALPNLTDAGNARLKLQILRDNPDIQLLCGREEADYKTFLQQLPIRPDSLVWEAQPDSHQAFVTAVSRHLSVEVYSPTETASALAQVHRSWLLTPDQAPVLHCHHRLLHLWGPPGAGKTLLLLHRVKLWLQDNKHVILCVGYTTHSVLLQHLGRTSVSGDGAKFSHNLTLCRHHYEFLKTVAGLVGHVPTEDICVVVDEVDDRFLSPALKVFQLSNIFCLWTASVEDIPDTESAKFLQLGGEKVFLPHCLRCPPHVVEVAGKVLRATPRTPAMTSFPCLPSTMPTASVKVCFHPFHPGYKPLDEVFLTFDCGECSHRLRSSLSPLVEGLPLQNPQWRHWVIVCTGNYRGVDKSVESKLVEWLRNQGVPAVSEMEVDPTLSNLPVSVVQQGSLGQGSGVMDESAERRERVVRGLDRHGNTAVHCVPYDQYIGMEKPCVLVLHWDREDELSNQSHTDDRKRRHREAWFRAMTRCQAELCVWIISPSPAASCLLLQEEMEEWHRIQEEQRCRHEDELARWTEEVQGRRRRLEAEKRLSEEEMERCRQEAQRIQEEEQRIQEEERGSQHEEPGRCDKELARQTEYIKDRRRRLEAEQRWSQEDMGMCSWEEKRIQMEEQQIQEEQRILEEERRRHDEAVQQMLEALQRHDVEEARRIREELERQERVQKQRQAEGRQLLEELELQMLEQQNRQREERQRWEEEEERRRRRHCVIQ